MIDSSLTQTKRQNINSSSVRLLIVDDQKVVRLKLQEIFSAHHDLEVIGVANNGQEALSLIKSLQPDVVLMDISMPKVDGIEATQIISQRFPNCKVLIISMHENQATVEKIFCAGARGYILKNIPAQDLISAIHSVNNGYSYFGTQLLQKIQQVLFNSSNSDHQANLGTSESKLLPSQNNQPLEMPQESSLNEAKTEEFLPSIGKWLSWGAIGVVTVIALAIPATSMLQYKTKVKTQAVVRPAGELRLVQAAMEGQITEIFVKEGQAVQKGELIATIDPTRLQTRKNQLEKAIAQQKLQLTQIDSQIAIVDSQINTEIERGNSEILTAKADLAENHYNYQEEKIVADSEVQDAQAQLKAAKATLAAAQNRQSRFQLGVSEGAISRERLAEAKLEVKQQQQEIKSALAQLQRARATLNPSASQIEMAQQRIQQSAKSGQIAIAGLQREQEALKQQRIATNQQLQQDRDELQQINTDLDNTRITATAAGKIFGLQLRNSEQTVQPGQEIAQVIPTNAALEIKTIVSPQDIGKLEPEQKVQIRISACPYPDYGVLKGKVSQIPQDTSKVENNVVGNNSPTGTTSPTFYEVLVTPDEVKFGRGKDICTLELGMEGTADIVTKEETVLKFLLRKARIISGV